jgi:AraC family L-rhamnose operon regulatory protein RhaS
MTAMHEMISYGHIENKLMYPHRNQGMEVVLVEKGLLEWAVDRVPEVLNPGTVFFTLPWQTHGSLMLREPPNRIFYALFAPPRDKNMPRESLRFPASLKFSAEEQRQLGQVFIGAQRHAWPATSLIKEIFPELLRRLDGTSELDPIAAASLLRALLVELADLVGQAQGEQQWLSPTVRKVKAFLSALGQSLDYPWTLNEMAQQCGVKRTQLANITKQLTAYAPAQYLHRIRFEKSCELLRNTELSVTDIAFECGYASSQYFSETFKKQARITPSEYRRTVPELDVIMHNHWDHSEWRTLSEEQRRANVIGKSIS